MGDSLDFDRWQFDDTRTGHGELYRYFGSEDVRRMQIVVPVPRKKHPPKIMQDRDELIANLRYRSKRGRCQKSHVTRWLYVLYLYYTCGWTAKEVGEEIGVTTSAIKNLLVRIKRDIMLGESLPKDK